MFSILPWFYGPLLSSSTLPTVPSFTSTGQQQKGQSLQSDISTCRSCRALQIHRCHSTAGTGVTPMFSELLCVFSLMSVAPQRTSSLLFHVKSLYNSSNLHVVLRCGNMGKKKVECTKLDSYFIPEISQYMDFVYFHHFPALLLATNATRRTLCKTSTYALVGIVPPQTRKCISAGVPRNEDVLKKKHNLKLSLLKWHLIQQTCSMQVLRILLTNVANCHTHFTHASVGQPDNTD